MDFSGKNVLVTGASRGIGTACAIQFAKAGATVAVHYNNSADKAQAVADSLDGEGHIVVQADMGDPDAVKMMVDTVVEQLGSIDVLVNNAGIYEYHKVAEVDYETWQASWQRTIEVNLYGAANALYCAAQHMIKQGSGRIVNVTSRGGFRGEPDAPAYGASKAGLNSVTGSMARSLAQHGVYVTAVAPGWIATDMANDYLDTPEGDDIRAQSPLNRVGTPDEIAHAVLYLASPGSEFTTGRILDVNGASYLRN